MSCATITLRRKLNMFYPGQKDCIFILIKMQGLFVFFLFWVCEFVSQQMGLCIFWCVASAAHFLFLKGMETMDKSEVICELRAKKSILQRIASLTEECAQSEQQKQGLIAKKGKKARERYQHDAELRNALPVDNAEKARHEIDKRHAKTSLKSARIVIAVAVVFSIAIYFIALFFFSNINFEEVSTADLAMTSVQSTVMFIFSGCWAYLSLKKKVREILSIELNFFERVVLRSDSTVGAAIVPLIYIVIISYTQSLPACIASLIPSVCLIPFFVNTKKKASYTAASDRRQLDEAEKKDAANKATNEKRLMEANAAAETAFKNSQSRSIAHLDSQVESCNSRISQLNREISELKKQVHSEMISDKDNNLEMVTILLDLLETGRADTLMDALKLADQVFAMEKANRERIAASWSQFNLQQQLAHWDRMDAKWEDAQKRSEAYDRERRHNEQVNEIIDTLKDIKRSHDS